MFKYCCNEYFNKKENQALFIQKGSTSFQTGIPYITNELFWYAKFFFHKVTSINERNVLCFTDTDFVFKKLYCILNNCVAISRKQLT